MANVVEAIRRIAVQATSRGVAEVTALLNKLGKAQDGVAVTARTQEKATQSMENRLKSIQRQYDANYRATETLSKVTRDLNAAEAQGLLTAGRKNELLRLARDRHRETATAVKAHDAAVGNLTRSIVRAITVYLSWRAVMGVMNQFIENTVEAERAQRQLETVVASTGAAAGLTADELDEMATALQRVTSYGDEQIKTAQALLLTFTRIGRDVFPDALEATLNVATALGTDLKSASMTVGKALNDPIKGVTTLGRAGIQFTAEQKRMVKAMVETGDVAGAQRLILKKLETQFGDTARAARGTLGGAMSALKEAWGDLFEANGPESEQMRRAVESLIDKLTDPKVVQAFQSLGTSLFRAMEMATAGIVNAASNLQWLLDLVSDYEHKSTAGLKTEVTIMRNEATRLANDNESIKARLAAGGAGTLFGLNDNALRDQMTKNSAQIQDRYNKIGELNTIIDSRTPPGQTTPPRTGPGLVGVDLSEDQLNASEKQRESYEKLIRTTEQRIHTSRMEAETLGMTTEAASRMRYEQELLNQAANDNIDLAPEQVDRLKNLATALAGVEERTRKLTEVYQFGKSTLGSFFQDMKSDLMSGVSLWDSLGNASVNALNKIGDKALGMLADGVWDLLFGLGKSALTGALGGGFGGGGNFSIGGSALYALGGVPGGKGISAYSGTVVDRPTIFPMARGAGLMGEAGEEAVMPLKRNSRGQLGVHVSNDNGQRAANDQGPIQVQVLVTVADDGKLVAIARQTGGQAAQIYVERTVPQMIKAQSPAATANQRSTRRSGG